MRLTTKFKELVDEKYPSIPRYADLVIFQEVAKDACEDQKGAGDDLEMLTGYEFRMCVRLYEVTKKLVVGEKVSSRERSGWITRYCVAMTTREIFYPQNYYKEGPHNRIFIWPDDVAEAVGRMNSLPAECRGYKKSKKELAQVNRELKRLKAQVATL